MGSYVNCQTFEIDGKIDRRKWAGFKLKAQRTVRVSGWDLLYVRLVLVVCSTARDLSSSPLQPLVARYNQGCNIVLAPKLGKDRHHSV